MSSFKITYHIFILISTSLTWPVFCCTVLSSYEVSPSEFTCTASSSYNSRFTCENVYTESKNGWITNGTGEGSWIKIEFHGLIQISKIIYRHNNKLPGKCCNQNFKDISLHFLDGTIANVTLDDWIGKETNVDFHYRINAPILSSYLLVTVNSVYTQPYKPERLVDGFLREAQYDQNRFGISTIRILGNIEAGKKREASKI